MTKTFDQMALDVMLSKGTPAQKQRQLASLAKQADRALTGGACPNCGNAGPHDDNGAPGAERTFLCSSCGEQWDAVQG